MEYLIGSGITLATLWLLWATHSIYTLKRDADGTYEVLSNHKEVIAAIGTKVAEADDTEDDTERPQMGFVSNN